MKLEKLQEKINQLLERLADENTPKKEKALILDQIKSMLDTLLNP